MSETYNAVVYHLTRIIMKVVEEPMPLNMLQDELTPQKVIEFGERLKYRADRVARMMELLAAKGFRFKIEKDVIYAESIEVEAQEAKRYLLQNGIQDREFQVYLEYTRKWGMM